VRGTIVRVWEPHIAMVRTGTMLDIVAQTIVRRPRQLLLAAQVPRELLVLPRDQIGGKDGIVQMWERIIAMADWDEVCVLVVLANVHLVLAALVSNARAGELVTLAIWLVRHIAIPIPML